MTIFGLICAEGRPARSRARCFRFTPRTPGIAPLLARSWPGQPLTRTAAGSNQQRQVALDGWLSASARLRLLICWDVAGGSSRRELEDWSMGVGLIDLDGENYVHASGNGHAQSCEVTITERKADHLVGVRCLQCCAQLADRQQLGGCLVDHARSLPGSLVFRWCSTLTLCLQSTCTLSVTVAGLGLSLFLVRPGRPLSGLVVVRCSGQLCLIERWLTGVPASASCPPITAGVLGRFNSIGSRLVERDDQSCLGRERQDQALVEELIDDRKLVSGQSCKAILIAGLSLAHLSHRVLDAGFGVDAQGVVSPSEFGVVSDEADRVEVLPDQAGHWMGHFLPLWRIQLADGHVGE